MGYCVVVPDIVSSSECAASPHSLTPAQTYFPSARIKSSVTDLRLVLRWVGSSITRYGGDPHRIHLMGHGLSAHLAMLTLTQEAVVLSREGHMERAYERELEKSGMLRWDEGDDDAPKSRAHATRGNGREQGPPVEPPHEDTAWVDEADSDMLPPGGVMAESAAAGMSHSARLATQLGSLGAPSTPRRVAGADAAHHGTSPTREQRAATREQSLANAESSIPNGLKRVEIYAPEVSIPPIAGLILCSGVSDVIKGFRNEVSASGQPQMYLC